MNCVDGQTGAAENAQPQCDPEGATPPGQAKITAKEKQKNQLTALQRTCRALDDGVARDQLAWARCGHQPSQGNGHDQSEKSKDSGA